MGSMAAMDCRVPHGGGAGELICARARVGTRSAMTSPPTAVWLHLVCWHRRAVHGDSPRLVGAGLLELGYSRRRPSRRAGFLVASGVVDLGLGCCGPRGLDQFRLMEARRSAGPSLRAGPNDPRPQTRRGSQHVPLCCCPFPGARFSDFFCSGGGVGSILDPGVMALGVCLNSWLCGGQCGSCGGVSTWLCVCNKGRAVGNSGAIIDSAVEASGQELEVLRG